MGQAYNRRMRRAAAVSTLVLVCLAGCARKTDPIRETIDAVVKAANARDTDALMARLAPEFEAADGASRLDIIALVTTQTIATALLGAGAGAAIGTLIVDRTLGTTPQPAFVVAIAALATLATALAALLPATIAAYRDPVRILRVP